MLMLLTEKKKSITNLCHKYKIILLKRKLSIVFLQEVIFILEIFIFLLNFIFINL